MSKEHESVATQKNCIQLCVDGREDKLVLAFWKERVSRTLGDRSEIDLTYDEAVWMEEQLGKVIDKYEELWGDEAELEEAEEPEEEEDGCSGTFKTSGDVCEPA